MSKKIQISGLTFELFKLPMLKRLSLDRKVGKMLLPVFAGMGDLSAADMAKALAPDLSPEDAKVIEEQLSEKIDLGTIAGAIGKALTELSDAEFMKLAEDLLSATSCTHPKYGATLLDSPEAINRVFEDASPIDVYNLTIEVMRENKFTPFALSGDGGGILGTVGSVVGTAATKKRGVKLARSGS